MTAFDPEFSHPVKIDSLHDKETRFKLKATPEECAGLAARFGIVSLDQLSAEVTVNVRKKGRLFAVKGQISAKLTQTCVVTLETLHQTVDCPFEVLFSTEEVEQVAENFDIQVMEMQDLPELIEEGTIDIGEVVAEQLSLEIDPFPRKDGVEFENVYNSANEGEKQPENDEKRDNPFAILSDFKKKLEKGT